MPKFSDIKKGIALREKGVECTTLEGEPFKFDLRMLTAAEEALTVANATTYAKGVSGAETNDSDLNWQFANCAEIVALAAVDPESSDDAPAPYFGACPDHCPRKCKNAVEQVRNHLDRERILLIAETHREFQERGSPRKLDLSEVEYTAWITTTALQNEGDIAAGPFFRWPRITQARVLRSMARRLVTLLALSSPSGSGSTSSEPS